ncbi:hypothetical protein JOM56_003845 [Amanita muscaria]
MGGPALEIFKFSLYLFVPVAALIHFGDPAWYRQNVLPASDYRDRLFPPSKIIQVSLPTDPHGIRAELDRIKSERLAKRAAQEDEGKQ